MSDKLDGSILVHYKTPDNDTHVAIKCFYDCEGDLPDKFIAIFSDASGCDIYYYSHDDQYGEKIYISTSDRDDIVGFDKMYFADTGYLWFIELPNDFKVWGEDE